MSLAVVSRTPWLTQVARRFRHGHLGGVIVRPETGVGRRERLAWWRGQISDTAFKVSILSTALIGIGKLTLGIAGLSLFIVVNGLFSIGMGAARFFCLATDEDHGSLRRQWRRYRWIGVALISAASLYTVYAIRLFTTPHPTTFGFSVALGIATITFVELGLAIQQSVTRRHDPSPLVHAAKLTTLASAVTALALVQIALRQIADTPQPGNELSLTGNAWGGLFFGSLTILIGVGMVIFATHRLRHTTFPPELPNS